MSPETETSQDGNVAQEPNCFEVHDGMGPFIMTALAPGNRQVMGTRDALIIEPKSN